MQSERAALFGVLPHDVAVASVFTTQSVMAIVEKIRDQVKLATPAPATFALGPGGTRAVYSASELTDIVSARQTGTAPRFSSGATPFGALSFMVPGAVGTIAFGKYVSADYLNAARYIPLAGTRGTPEVQGTNEIFFTLTLPATSPPPLGWPVAIWGHGGGGDKEELFLVAAKMAEHGIATISINAVGHGFGPLSTLSLLRGANTPITLPAGGRGIDTDADGQITAREGSLAVAPREIIRERHARIQTAADLMQLIRVIEVGIDVDGDGAPDLDPSHIYYFGHSLGGNYGAVFLAAEERVRAGVLIAPGGPIHELVRLSPLSRGTTLGALLAARVPSLINLSGTNFDENLPLRDQPLVINTVVPYGAYLRRAPLDGVEPKSVIIQFAAGDRNVPNPVTTAILRSGELADRATYYRFDLFLASNPTTPPSLDNPHGFIYIQPPFVTLPPDVRAAANAVALGALEQIAVFFASDGLDVIDPDGPRALSLKPRSCHRCPKTRCSSRDGRAVSPG